jgi:hypothetical protein
MGQYYKPINLDDKQWLYTHDYDTGLKLMEHSWIGNQFVGVVMNLMLKGGLWFKKRIVWAGDYYGDQGEEVHHWNNHDSDDDKIHPTIFMDKETQKKAKLVNHTKKLYVRYDEMPTKEVEWVINPLPLLTALGNGRGGGDYYEKFPDFDKVGSWAGDVLSIEMAVPKSQWYKKLVVNFKES